MILNNKIRFAQKKNFLREFNKIKEDFLWTKKMCIRDRYNRYSRYNDDFIKPIFFDEILNNFVNNLSEDEIKNLFVQGLKRNERYTFEKYLQKEYEKYLLNSKNTHALIDKINSRFKKLSDDYDFNYNDFSVQLLNKSEKKKIKEIYESEDKLSLIHI